MSNVSDFCKCVDEKLEDGVTTIECKMGLWSASSIDEKFVFIEAFHYWKQYKEDGEYSSILGGESATEKLTNQIRQLHETSKTT